MSDATEVTSTDEYRTHGLDEVTDGIDIGREVSRRGHRTYRREQPREKHQDHHEEPHHEDCLLHRIGIVGDDEAK